MIKPLLDQIKQARKESMYVTDEDKEQLQERLENINETLEFVISASVGGNDE